MGRPKCLEYYVTVRVRYNKKQSGSIEEQHCYDKEASRMWVSQLDALYAFPNRTDTAGYPQRDVPLTVTNKCDREMLAHLNRTNISHELTLVHSFAA
jgi:hypothetical protein